MGFKGQQRKYIQQRKLGKNGVLYRRAGQGLIGGDMKHGR